MTKDERYGTHLPILDEVVPKNSTAVEFGCGHHSTPFLLKRCRSLISIEMQDHGWMTKVEEEYGDLAKKEVLPWIKEVLIGPFQFLRYRFTEVPDVALIDGHGKSRWACVNLMMQLGVDTIIAHDTDVIKYRWDYINREGYTEAIYTDQIPWTTVWLKKTSE